jgi:hypothetical protein
MDGKEVGKTPLAAALLVMPGEHRLTLAWRGESKSKAFAIGEGEASSLDLVIEDRPPVVVVEPALPPPPPRPWYRSHWAWIAGGAVVVAAATTAVLLYGNQDHVPDPTMGKQTIGD